MSDYDNDTDEEIADALEKLNIELVKDGKIHAADDAIMIQAYKRLKNKDGADNKNGLPVLIAKILYDNWGKVTIKSLCVGCAIPIGACPFDIIRERFKTKDWNLQLLVKDCKDFIKTPEG